MPKAFQTFLVAQFFAVLEKTPALRGNGYNPAGREYAREFLYPRRCSSFGEVRKDRVGDDQMVVIAGQVRGWERRDQSEIAIREGTFAGVNHVGHDIDAGDVVGVNVVHENPGIAAPAGAKIEQRAFAG